MSDSPLDTARLSAAAARISFLAAGFVVLAKIVARFDVATLYDDAYMFQRYARNVLGKSGIAWNPGGPPTYGLTSPWSLLVAIPARLAAGVDRPALAALLTSLVSGIAFLVLVVLLVRRASTASAQVQRSVLMLTFFSMALCQTPNHFVGGMDTMLGMAYFAAYLLLAARVEASPSRRNALLLGLAGAFSLGVRPELTLVALLAPAAMGISRDLERRRAGRRALVVTAVLLGVHLLFAQRYFHSALPLPFYAKARGLYGPTIHHQYRGRSTIELTLFLGDYWPLFGLVALDLAMGLKRAWERVTALEVATLASVLAMMGWSWLFVLQIMYYDQRFYHPVLPGLVFLAARAAARIEKTLERDLTPTLAALGLLTWFWLAPAAVGMAQDLTHVLMDERTWRFDHLAFAKTNGPQKNWYRPEAFAALPDDLTMATSEVGLVSALAPRKKIMDLAGLNDAEIARHGFSARYVFADGGPDLLYIPHPDYREFIKALLEAPEIQGYDLYPATHLGTILGVGLKRSSKHHAKMKALMGDRTPVQAWMYDPSLKIPAPPGPPAVPAAPAATGAPAAPGAPAASSAAPRR